MYVLYVCMYICTNVCVYYTCVYVYMSVCMYVLQTSVPCTWRLEDHFLESVTFCHSVCPGAHSQGVSQADC